MPKFAPNTGFKMPGVGSKNIDSPGNFRDEQHVDKVGYCDTTDDRMLPEGSSPLKVRYASSGYLKDLDAIQIPQKKKKESVVCPKGSTLVNGKCVADNVEKDPPTTTTTPPPTEKDSVVPVVPVKKDVPVVSSSSSRSKDIENSNYKGKKMSKEAWNALPLETRRRMNANVGADKSGNIQKITYYVNEKVSTKAGYDAADPAKRSKS